MNYLGEIKPGCKNLQMSQIVLNLSEILLGRMGAMKVGIVQIEV